MDMNSQTLLRNRARELLRDYGGYEIFIGSDVLIPPALEFYMEWEFESDLHVLLEITPASQKSVKVLQKIRIEPHNLVDCSICLMCLDDFDVGECVTVMLCENLFHDLCVYSWFVEHNSCPMCRLKLPMDNDNEVAQIGPVDQDPQTSDILNEGMGGQSCGAGSKWYELSSSMGSIMGSANNSSTILSIILLPGTPEFSSEEDDSIPMDNDEPKELFWVPTVMRHSLALKIHRFSEDQHGGTNSVEAEGGRIGYSTPDHNDADNGDADHSKTDLSSGNKAARFSE